MNRHVKEYYRPFSPHFGKGNFYSVISLQDCPDNSWDVLFQLAPTLPKGWYELSHLPLGDRIEFTRDYWLTSIGFHPLFEQFLTHFFFQIDDIGIFLVQEKKGGHFIPEMVYSLGEEGGFFRGKVPANEGNFDLLESQFRSTTFPKDYFSFLRIHDGFCKSTDSTGILSSLELFSVYQELKLDQQLITSGSRIVNPKTLIPFYASFGQPYFQCFWQEWYPQGEMGNVYFRAEQTSISDITRPSEEMAFSTFIDWLIFYLEPIRGS